MYRKILAALIFVSFFSFGATKSEVSSNSNSHFIYSEPLELAPYTDGWFINGDLKNLNHLKIRRDGKSGDLSAPVSIDCKSKKLIVTGNGLLYTSEPISSSEVSQQISKDVIEAVLQKVCGVKTHNKSLQLTK